MRSSEDVSRETGRLGLALKVLAGMIVALMALGAGVRTMNAGLACPDWPLCFGAVIPRFHLGVYFEFIHRAYAGIVSLVYFACVVWIFRARGTPLAARALAIGGVFLLGLQILMGAWTVLKQLKSIVVTSHLMLATLLFSCVLWMAFLVSPREEAESRGAHGPLWLRVALVIFPIAILLQMTLGGLVASTYAGSVCVDFPLCNGQWAPTFQGAIGQQVMHRFGAYAVVVLAFAIAGAVWVNRREPWAGASLRRASEVAAGVAFAQMCIGIANLVLYIPPGMTVLHQTGAVATLAAAYRMAWLAWVGDEAAAADAVVSRSTARTT